MKDWLMLVENGRKYLVSKNSCKGDEWDLLRSSQNFSGQVKKISEISQNTVKNNDEVEEISLLLHYKITHIIGLQHFVAFYRSEFSNIQPLPYYP